MRATRPAWRSRPRPGRRSAAFSSDGAIKLLAGLGRRAHRTMTSGAQGGCCWPYAISPDGSLLASAGAARTSSRCGHFLPAIAGSRSLRTPRSGWPSPATASQSWWREPEDQCFLRQRRRLGSSLQSRLVVVAISRTAFTSRWATAPARFACCACTPNVAPGATCADQGGLTGDLPPGCRPHGRSGRGAKPRGLDDQGPVAGQEKEHPSSQGNAPAHAFGPVGEPG